MGGPFPGSGRPTHHNGGVHRGLTYVLISCSVVVAGVVAPVSAAHSATAARHPFRGAMPRHAETTRAALTTATPEPLAEYLGGKVLQHVKVYGVLWGSGGTFQPVVTNASPPNMADFFTRVANSRYVDWLGEYSTGSQFIGRGSFAGMYTITPAHNHDHATVDDEDDIQPELIAQIAAGHLPLPSANSLYVLMFRSGQTITRDGTRSDTDYCAYHSTTTSDFVSIRYAVLPDTASDAGCGSAPGAANFTAVASHELVESITDPDVGLGTLAWYDSENGEISDICENHPSGFTGLIEGYRVVSNWSNEAKACILSGLPRTIAVGGGSILEGDSNTRTLKIPVTLSQPSHFNVTVHYSLQSITARGASSAATGVDFLTTSGTVTFKPSSTTGLTPVEQLIGITVRGDKTHEANESLSVRLSSPSLGYAIARSSGTGTILNDDVATAPLGVGVGDATIMVAMHGDHLLSFPVTLSHTVASTVTVRFAFSHVTANYGVDYSGSKTGTVTIRPGARQGTASITVLASSTITQTRTLIVTLSSLYAPTGSKLAHSVGTGTLLHPAF
jgi:hypothetical protein